MTAPPLPYASCSICAGLAAYVEIENAQEPSQADVAQGFPDEVATLQVPNAGLEQAYRHKSERLLKCSACGTYYWYRTWAPGGSEDVLHTYIHESVRRLSFLETYVELEDLLYQATEREREYGSVYAAERQAAEQGVGEEMALLHERYREIAWDAVGQLEHKYRRAEELEETLRRYAPALDPAQRVAEARVRDEAAARYYAGVLAEQFGRWEGEEVPVALLQRAVGLLADADPAVRAKVAEGLIALLRGVQSG